MENFSSIDKGTKLSINTILITANFQGKHTFVNRTQITFSITDSGIFEHRALSRCEELHGLFQRV